MASHFNQHGIPSIALSTHTPKEERLAARTKLDSGEINFIFVVDLFNEGVDIPSVDTLLLLRPTESLTIYLQQLGRGLRLHPNKECLTVLDFIAAHCKEFKFGPRFQALCTNSTGNIEHEITEGFPHIPSGCSVEFERVAQDRVLNNIRSAINPNRPKFLAHLKELGNSLDRIPSITEAMSSIGVDLDRILRYGLWSELLSDAGLTIAKANNDSPILAKGLRRIAHVDDPQLIDDLLNHFRSESPATPANSLSHERRMLAYVSIWGNNNGISHIAQADSRLWNHPTARKDLCQLLDIRRSQSHTRTRALTTKITGPLALHSAYTRDEILIGLGRWNLDDRPPFREGVLHLPASKVDAFFVTLQKTGSEFSPTTMYEDYAINEHLFHWQSQSQTSDQSHTGQRYIRHRELGYTPLLFVRETRKASSGLSVPYIYLGPADYVSHKGSKPINFIWKLRNPIPARLRPEVGLATA